MTFSKPVEMRSLSFPASSNRVLARTRATSVACINGWISMKLGRKLKWDTSNEIFEGDDAANSMLSRPERAPYGLSHLKKG